MFVDKGSPSLVCDNVLPSPLEHSHVSTFCSQPLFSPEYTYDVPVDNFEICDSNVDMGHEDNMLSMLSGNVETFESLGNSRGYDAPLDPYCIYLVDKPRKILMEHFLHFLF